MRKLYLVIAKHHLPGVLQACPQDALNCVTIAESAQGKVHQRPDPDSGQQASAEITRDVPEIVKVIHVSQEGRVITKLWSLPWIETRMLLLSISVSPTRASLVP